MGIISIIENFVLNSLDFASGDYSPWALFLQLSTLNFEVPGLRLGTLIPHGHYFYNRKLCLEIPRLRHGRLTPHGHYFYN